MAVVLAPPVLVCPNCSHRAVRSTRLAPGQAVTDLHECRGMAGLVAPLYPEGMRVSVVAQERDDYVGTEDVRLDGNGRPVMSIVATRDDGTDAIVFAPTAHRSLAEAR